MIEVEFLISGIIFLFLLITSSILILISTIKLKREQELPALFLIIGGSFMIFLPILLKIKF